MITIVMGRATGEYLFSPDIEGSILCMAIFESYEREAGDSGSL